VDLKGFSFDLNNEVAKYTKELQVYIQLAIIIKRYVSEVPRTKSDNDLEKTEQKTEKTIYTEVVNQNPVE
tara:strand:- start:335 stop:544 length:210 start_codon:yes stop_codon:yes gene_type:complete